MPNKLLNCWRSHLRLVLHVQGQAVFNLHPFQRRYRWRYQLSYQNGIHSIWIMKAKLRNTFLVSFFSSQWDSERESRQEFRWLQSHGSHALNIFGFEMMLFRASFPSLAMAVERKNEREMFWSLSIRSGKLWSALLVLRDAVALSACSPQRLQKSCV